MKDLKNVNDIRLVTKDAYKDLGELLDGDGKHLPIFGYALLNYSPN